MSNRSRNRGIASLMFNPAPIPLIAQFLERPPAARGQLAEMGGDVGFASVAPDVEIVDQQEIDAVDAKALQAVLERAHDAVVAVVEHRLELRPADPLVFDRAWLQRPPQDAADLTRDDELAAGFTIKRPADTMLGLPAAVPGRSVEIAHAPVPSGADDRRRLVVLDHLEEITERRRAEAELGYADIRRPELARFQGSETSP